MTSSNIDYQAVLEDLERRREELDSAINSIRAILGQPATEATGSSRGSSRSSSSASLAGAFLGMSISEAAKKYLAMVKKPLTAPEIAEGLEEGGIISQSSNFTGTVYATLRRVETGNGSIVQLPGAKWALAEWVRNQPKAKTLSEVLKDAPRPVDAASDLSDAVEAGDDPDGDEGIEIEV